MASTERRREVGGAERGRRWAVVALLIVAGLLPLAVRALQRRGFDTSGVTPAWKRGVARQLQFARVDGGEWSLADERGHVVLVNLWATWCGPCREETPLLERMSEEMRGDGMRVMGLSLDEGRESEARVRAFARAYHVTYPLALPDARSHLDQGLEGLPTSMLFDREGRLAKVYVGTVSERGLRRDVEMLLAER